MRKSVRRLLLVLFSCLSVLFMPLTPANAAQGPAALPVPIPQMPPLGAKAYVLMDYQSGQLLVEKNPNEHMAPASTTKLMTAYVVFQELKSGRITLDTKFRVSEKAWRQGGSRMFLKLGSEVTVNDLLQGLLIPSGNDAAMTLAQGIAGTSDAFVALMNSYAKHLGLANTHYTDPTGLPNPGLYTSPLDLAKLSRAIIQQFPEYYHYFSQKEFTWNNIKQYNYNKLLWRDSTADGLKTGYTKAAGYCLASSAKRGDTRMIAVVMGANKPKASSEANYLNLARLDGALLNYGFRFYSTHKLYDAGKSLTEARIWQGAKQKIQLGLANTLYVTVPSGQYSRLKAEMNLPGKLSAPVAKGQSIGQVVVKLGDRIVAKAPLVALEADPRGNLWQRVRDTVLQWFKK
jgi:serine-type D-Ala-D-Ala carboxypeptidase (penicillin-binding protein 5/6)